MTKVRIGVVGCGQLARAAHIPLLERNPSVELVGLCDAHPTSLASSASLAPGAQRYEAIDELLTTHAVDAVVISLPSHLHADAATAAFRHGAHVYLEKPVASSMSDARKIVQAWRQSNRVGMIGHNFRFNPLAVRMRKQIAAGIVGSVTTIQTHYATPRPPAESWRRTRSTGGGALLDLAVHHIDFVRFILGAEIASVSAKIESRTTEHDFGALSLTTPNGVTANIEVEFGDSFHDRIEVQGDRATLWIDRAHSVDVGRSAPGEIGPASVVLAHLPTPGRVAYWALRRRSPFHEPSFAIAMDVFVNAAITGVQATPDLLDGLAGFAVIDAAERSSVSGKPESVS